VKVKVMLDVPKDAPGNYSGRDVHAGEEFFVFQASTYGCVNESTGIALSEKGEISYPFFEFPREALEAITYCTHAHTALMIQGAPAMAKTYIPKVPMYKATHYADLAAFMLSIRGAIDDYDYVVRQMANWLTSDNADFSRERFYASAGYGGLGEIHQHRKSE
jgi:hypothetical protein